MARLTDEDIARSYSIVGKNIRRSRGEAGMTVDELSARSGLEKADLMKMEEGSAKYGIDELFSVSLALNVTVSELVEGV